MNLIIAGGRDYTDFDDLVCNVDWLRNALSEEVNIFSGGARGADRLGEQYAKANDLNIRYFIPDWEGQGKGAGFIRNTEMANRADALIAFWDGKSRGTKHMIDTALSKGLLVQVVRY